MMLLALLLTGCYCLVPMVTADRCPAPEDIMPCRCRGRNDQIQVWCNHSDLDRVNNALENLMRLRSMPAIDELIVENNKMPTLPARAFGALRIGRLLLRNNGLESISRNAFAGLENSLEEIYIVEETLLDFPFDSIEQLKNLEAFTIERSKIPWLPKFSGLNRLKHVRIDGSGISGLPVGAFAKIPSIKQIHVVNSLLVSLPDGIFGPLDTLQLANFSGNQINTVQRRSFARLPKLEILCLSKNRLQDAVSVGRAAEELPSLKSLDLSGNSFKILPEGSFVHLRSLQMLNLGSNRIHTVGQRSFTHLPALRKVDLSDNQLRNIPKLFFDSSPLLEEVRIRKNLLSTPNEIGELLSSLKSLRFLDLGENGVTTLSPGTIADHSQLQKLDLSDNLIGHVHKDAFRNVPSLVELSLRNNSLQTLPSEAESWKIPSLGLLDLSNNKIHQIPPSALTSLTGLTRLDLSYNRVKAIGSLTFVGNTKLEELELIGNGLNAVTFNSFSGLAQLKLLDLSRNHLDAIPSATFRDLGSLQRLNLGHNRISTVPTDVFQKLKFLEELSLKSNSIGHLHPELFKNLENLKELNLKQNAIGQLTHGVFSDLKNLRGLKLASNKISTIDDSVFDDLPKLKGIDLSSNRITRLTSASLKGLVGLEKFDARENRITTVEPGAFRNSQKIQMVDLAQNALEVVPDFVKSGRLRVADFSHNQILKLDRGMFGGGINLMELYLNDNKLKEINAEVFKNLEALTILDLDGNDVTELTEGAFTNLPRLIYLRLSRNKLRTIHNRAFKGLTSVDGMDFQENELESIGESAFERSPTLKYLNLSHNNFDDMARLGLYPLAALEVLDISYNRLRIFDDKALRHLQWLVELRVNDNGICTLPQGVFDGMSRLKMLVLKNNSISNLPEAVFYKLKNNIAFVDFSGNSLICDCELLWLKNLMTRESVKELTEASCAGPGDLKGQPIKTVRPGRMVCTSGSNVRENFKPDSTSACPNMPISKRKPRPVSPEPFQKPVFADSPARLTDGESEVDGKNQRRNKDEKFLASHDYVAGDSPTIYAGSIIKPNNNIQSEKLGSGLSALSTLFGIPLPNLDFGLNLGISPSVSISDQSEPGSGPKPGFKGQHPLPLPPSWIQRPSKVGIQSPVQYEPPEYIPRKPIQPYIPLNPYANAESELNPSFLPSRTAMATTSPKSGTWHPSYPTVETGFIPIKPFFHRTTTSVEPVPVSMTTVPRRPFSTTQISTTQDLVTSELHKPTETPLVIAEESDETSAQTLEETDGDSLNDFWGLFTKEMNSTKENPPLDFSAPIDTSDFSSTSTPEVNEVTESFIGGQTQGQAQSQSFEGRKSKGKSTITKVKLDENHRSTSTNNGGPYGHPSTNALVYTGDPRVPTKTPGVPPVIIGQADEPLDWYYKNYDVQHNPEEEIEKYLDRSRVNTVDDRLIDFGSAGSIPVRIVIPVWIAIMLINVF